jgi:WD40 repeat protein
MTTIKLRGAMLLLTAAIIANSGALSAESAPVDAFGDPLPPGAIARMGTVCLRHGSQVYTIAYSPDGKLLASGSAHGELRLWDPATGKLVQRLVDPFGSVFRVIAFSPDGERLASDKGGTLGLWQVSTGKKLLDLEPVSTGRPSSLAFSPDGKVRGCEVMLWDIATGKEVCQCKGRLQGDMAFSPDGRTVAAGGVDGVVYLFDAATGKELPVSRAGWNRGTPNAVGFTPDDKGLILRSINGGGIHLCETATGKVIREYSTDKEWPQAAALSPDGKTLAAGTSSGTILLYETSTGQILHRLKGQERQRDDGRDRVLAFAPDGRTVAAAGENVIRLWDAATGKELQQFRGHEGDIWSLFFTPDGKTLVSSGKDETTRFWEVTNGKERTPEANQLHQRRLARRPIDRRQRI